MPESKWNISAVNVHGQAMFGDGNQMTVLAAAQTAVMGDLLARIEEAIEAIPEHGPASLRSQERASAHASLGELAQELKKNSAEQNRGVLSRSLDRISEVLKLAPSAVSAVLAIKSLVGL